MSHPPGSPYEAAPSTKILPVAEPSLQRPRSNAAGNAVRHRGLNGRPGGARIYDSVAAHPPRLIPRVVLRFFGPRRGDAALLAPAKP